MTSQYLNTIYDYPDNNYSRVEGKSRYQLEEEIMAGGPFADSRLSRIYFIASNENEPLHFVAKHYLYLSKI